MTLGSPSERGQSVPVESLRRLESAPHAYAVRRAWPPFSPDASARVSSRRHVRASEPARVVGLRLTKRGAGEHGYRPRVQFPFLIMLWHNLNREQMTVKFDPDANGGTRVTISGAVARGNHAVAADPEHWSEALGGSTPAAV